MNSTCDNCIRRKTTCISQEYNFVSKPRPKHVGDGVEARLSRAEQILVNADVQPSANTSPLCCNTTPVLELPEPDATSETSSQSPDLILLNTYTGLARELVAVWPAQQDLDRIYNLPIGYSTHMHMMISSRSPIDIHQGSISTRVALQLPLPGSHPVLIARKLLILGSLLLGALSTPGTLNGTQDHFSDIMSRAVDTAVRLVTTNDSLTASVEGIECIMFEAMIQNYTGSLHLAWQTVRRASAVAQMLGLHRSSKSASLNIIDPETRCTFDQDQLSFRIVQMDRYLSLTLGLPHSSLNLRAITSGAPTKLDRMAHLHCIISEHILAREEKKSPDQDSEYLDKMENMLQEAAAEVEPQWWLIPDVASSHDQTFQDVIRSNYQFSHYHLLLRLHLPYVLRHSASNTFDHSKLTAVHASREILSRYASYRTLNPGAFYCRGVDFFAFIALSVICIAHINTRCPADLSNNDAQSSTTVRKVLAQSHHGDRGVMERTLLLFEQMEGDTITTKLSCIAQHLLAAEINVSSGERYCTSTSETDGSVAECEARFMDGDGTLQLRIPYFGTVNLQRIPTGESILPQATDAAQRSIMEWDAQWMQQNTFSSVDLDGVGNGGNRVDDWTLQSINESLFGTLFSGKDGGSADCDDWEVWGHSRA
ncbi:hypothetical protein GQ44DRAFT_614965 [Phaeosphaeriaceae sp. PMI808]|nr:hypothetical protein GQ44DRAFT_614965 [Phaeosphaeriaceae sp. PMI808]